MGINKFNAEGYNDPTAYEAMTNIVKEEKAFFAFRPIVYICSPYAGDIEKNVSAARKYSKFAVDTGYLPIAPHLLFPQFMDDGNPKERELAMFFGNVDLPQKAFCRAWNLIVAKKLRYQATLRSTVDNAEDILVRYRAEEMCLLIDEIGKITEFSYPLMLKTLDRVVVNTNGKLTFIFQSGIKITV